MYHLTGRLIDYEMGRLSEEDTLALLQELVDTGIAWTLQGSYGRTAAGLLEAGLIKLKGGEQAE